METGFAETVLAYFRRREYVAKGDQIDERRPENYSCIVRETPSMTLEILFVSRDDLLCRKDF
jgi:hypothetical protein